ncbi:MAG: alkaline phosphatase, partial [Spirochaetes bacterium]|nr:alkaline phosphatase [Spirochaetota bacterium]
RTAEGEPGPTAFREVMKSGGCGYALTWAADALVTDSAAAATALASGVKTNRGRLGIDPGGRKLTSVLEIARSRGMATGIVTDTRVTHATPAGFYAHVMKRDAEARIATQLLEGPGVDVVLGGGAALFVPAGTSTAAHPLLREMRPAGMSKRRDRRDLVTEFARKGYRVVYRRKGLMPARGGRLLGIFAPGHMNSAVDRDDEDTGEPSVVEMTEAAIGALSMNRRGFFLMIECGRIDYDAHSNDMGALLCGVREMERVVAACERFRRRRGGVLLVFTGDHETGGPAFSYYSPGTGGSGHTSSPTFSTVGNFLKQKRSMRSLFSSPPSSQELLREFNSAMPFPITAGDAERIYRLIGSSPRYE